MSAFHLTIAAGAVLGTCLMVSCAQAADDDANARARRFIERYEKTIRPLELEAALATWAANLTGSEDDFKKKEKAETELLLKLSDPEQFAELKAIKGAGPSDPILAREITVLYLGYLSKQVDHDLLRAMTAKDNAIQRMFNVHRPKLNGKEITDNEVRRVLRESHDSAERKAAWEASKEIGGLVAKDLMELVAMRNKVARSLGYADYHVMQLSLAEQDQAQIMKLFDELDELTRKPFHDAKAELDAALAKNCGITVEQLRPWHYHDPFFQESPAVLGELPDAVYTPLDTIKVCREFYDGIALPVDGVLKNSDLYEKPGKNPHAFCIDMNREGDVRILANVVPGRQWLTTMLHELGHAVYSEYVGPSLPYVLHCESHTLCTEGVAMMYERFGFDADWLMAMGAKIPNPAAFREAAAKLQRNRKLIFSRYCQVMFRFEAELYAKAETMNDPERDLGRLWWDLVEKYQEIKRPDGRDEPDFASKYHIVGAPAYYHNYQLGEMFASQMHHALVRDLLPGTKPADAIYVGNKKAGQWMRQRVFQPGLSMDWNELARHATGEPLSPKALAEDISVGN